MKNILAVAIGLSCVACSTAFVFVFDDSGAERASKGRFAQALIETAFRSDSRRAASYADETQNDCDYFGPIGWQEARRGLHP